MLVADCVWFRLGNAGLKSIGEAIYAYGRAAQIKIDAPQVHGKHSGMLHSRVITFVACNKSVKGRGAYLRRGQ